MVLVDETYEYNNILIGENKADNDMIISKSKQTDIWFHLANLPSCHVIISCNRKHPINKQMIKYCADLVKQHTKYKYLRKVKVNYTQIKNVKKTKTQGLVNIKGKCNTVVI